MKRRTVFLLILVLILLHQAYSLAENKSVKLGDTGIFFEVDTSFEIITLSNKNDYTQDIQNAITSKNEIMGQSPNYGSFFVIFDQGKNLEQHDLSNKKVEEIEKNYSNYISDELLSEMGEYDISVYDSGTSKWIRVLSKTYNMIYYATVQGNRSVFIGFKPIGFDRNNIELIIDSFNFGSPSFWSGIKLLANKITSFGYRILGNIGVYIIWTIIGSFFLLIISPIYYLANSLITASSNKNKNQVKDNNRINDTQNHFISSSNEEYIQYIMSNNISVKREDVESFSLVLDVYDKTKNTEQALKAFDSFMTQLADVNPLHARMVYGFFCGLLGSNLNLSDTEISLLTKKYENLVMQKINNYKNVVTVQSHRE